MSTMNPQAKQTLAAFEAIRREISRADRSKRDWKTPAMDIHAMEPAWYSQQSRRASLDEAETAIKDFPADQGWICRQSTIDVFQAPNQRPASTQGGALLSAELVSKANSRSLHVRQNGHGDWIITEISEGDANDPAATEGLAHTSCLIGDQRVEGWLHYRVFWTHEEPFGWRASASRFLGITKDPKHTRNPCNPCNRSARQGTT
ncbi:MAG: hypothetical protein ACPGU7_13095 [Gammaproteobacteria bacterium]